jgi:RimJ/RimL family protein N-acetyltransferase
LADDLTAERRRPEWLWVALQAGRVVARAGWWGPRGSATPTLLDFLDVADVPNRIEVGVNLLQAALPELFPSGARPPDYLRFVPPDWRQAAESRQIVEARMEIATRVGAHLLAERLRFDWYPGTVIAEPTGRLSFRAVGSDAELIELMTLALAGTLDAHSRIALGHMPATEVARQHFEGELKSYRSPREWWRIATLANGEAVGFVTPARNDYNAILAYLGVLPGHRGRGYVDEILAEGTRVLAAQDVPRIRASTDLDNVPMAQAFLRAGWDNFERAITMTWS